MQPLGRLHLDNIRENVANFGVSNAVELIVSVLALVKGQVDIVQESLIGSILSNLLLVMGMCFFFGGLNRVEQHFNITVAQTASSMLALAVGSLIIPAAFQAWADGTRKFDSWQICSPITNALFRYQKNSRLLISAKSREERLYYFLLFMRATSSSSSRLTLPCTTHQALKLKSDDRSLERAAQSRILPLWVGICPLPQVATLPKRIPCGNLRRRVKHLNYRNSSHSSRSLLRLFLLPFAPNLWLAASTLLQKGGHPPGRSSV